jgi:hypothetical protein
MAPDLQIEVEKERLPLFAAEGVDPGRMDMRFVPATHVRNCSTSRKSPLSEI